MTGAGDRPAGSAPGGDFEVVAIASSAGGITALSRILGGLPADFPVPVLVVQHLHPRHDTIIADVLNRRTALPVRLATAGERAESGVVHIAPPNFHLLVESDRTLALTSSELVHFVRPAADPLFESLADAYGPGVIACVLTGSGSDGARGASAVKSRGGTVIVQDPCDAECTGMPEAAIRTGTADLVVPLAEIADAICGLVEQPAR
ncbi:chemotaxis protein CheB [Nocardia wallacei]|uniref:chemotaxis protein CheB n=1 Tax=Nocardia wallacei TaxID=480035 RepID=UPI0024559F0E|nr:chemotaxis protein CheB [Nocardia wallacei]